MVKNILLIQLVSYLNKISLLSPNESAYRPEIALLNVTDDFFLALDSGNVSKLTLLDLSAAFDTVDQHNLFKTLKNHLGIFGPVWSWFQSYLLDRTQVVAVNGCFSSKADLLYGVPQGSVLRSALFNV